MSADARSPASRSAGLACSASARDVLPGSAGVLERAQVVVREQLGVVLRPPQGLDPRRRGSVQVGAPRTRDLPVGDVAHEPVAEDVLVLAGHGGATLALDELLADERVHGRVDGRRIGFAERGDRTDPEDAADDRRVLERGLLLGRQRVDPGGDQPLDRLGERQVACVCRPGVLRGDPGELLGVERIPAGPLEQRRLHVRRQHRLGEQRVDEACGLVLRQRRQRHRRRVQLASAPARPPRQQLGPRRADEEHRHAGRPLDEVVDEVEQALVGPVQVLEDEHERPAVAERLEEAPPGRERLGARVAAALALLCLADQRAQIGHDPAGLLLVADRRDGALELRVDRRRGVSLSRMPASALTISASAQ